MAAAGRAVQRACVLVRNVPRTALPDDVRRVSAAASGARIDFLRTPLLQASGDVLLSMADEARAEAYCQRAARAVVGGEALAVDSVRGIADQLCAEEAVARFQRQYQAMPVSMYAALDVIAAEPFHCVVLQNLPLQTTAEKLEKKLRRSYDLVGRPNVPHPLSVRRLTPLGGVPGGARLPSACLGAEAHGPLPSVLALPTYVCILTQHTRIHLRLVPSPPANAGGGHAVSPLVAPDAVHPAKVYRRPRRRPVRDGRTYRVLAYCTVS